MAITDTQQTAQFAASAAVSAAEAKQYALSIEKPIIDIAESVDEAKNAAIASGMYLDETKDIATGLSARIDFEISEKEAEFESQMQSQRSEFELAQQTKEDAFLTSQVQMDSDFNLSQTEKEDRFQQFLISSGYVFLGGYEDGPFQFSARNQYIRYNNQYYRLNAATDVGFTTTGTTAASFANDVTHFVLMDGDTLRQNLGSDEDGMGSWITTHVQKLIVTASLHDFLNNSIKFITPFMFKNLVVGGDWSAAIVQADAKAAELGLPLMGFGQSFSVRSLSLISDHVEGVGFAPVAGYIGAGPTFKINQVTGNLYFKGSCKGFTSVGAKFIRGNFSGIPQLTLDACEFSGNGSLLRTTCVNAVNTASDFVIPVLDASGFIVGNYIWIGDSKCMIAGISGNTITLVNNGSAPTLYSGGTGTGSYKAGQFFTRDGDGKNGATIGEGGTEAGWGLTIQNGIKLMNNGWFGLFHYVRAKGGTVSIKGKVEGGNNGYCAMGLAYVQGGEISGFKFFGNGNNGLDIFETTGDLSVSDGLVYENGVDGIFICGNGTGPKISRIKTRNNLRIGILAYGRSSAPVGFNITDCECINDGLYNICMTGVRSGDVRGNTLGGAKEAIKVEGRNGLLNPSGITIDSNVFTLESTDNDINANIGGYTDGGESGAISVLNNRYNGRNPKHTISNFNRSQSRFLPVGRMSFTSSYTAAAGATISVPLVFYKPNATSNIDVLGGQVEIQICSNPSLLTIGTVSSALRTAGIELSNGATTNGKILAMAAFGTLSYNFTLTTAGIVYLNVRSPYGDGVIQLTWT
ncbi:hypothetical protein [Klebsiella michiganensis]|uniref:hypothetical protein n=1 Tax=Klebsiella michiganensis TaxID=1134687 RepID=UPI00249C5260|nr:hypothetical protein [Klebsiella michiganensis]MDI3223466.1 hypothetical protein [Klebsiella michiganensis]